MSSNLNWRSTAVLTVIGVTATLVLAVTVVITLLRIGGAGAVLHNLALIGLLVALGGVFTSQLINIALRQRQSLQQRGPTEQSTEQRVPRLTSTVVLVAIGVSVTLLLALIFVITLLRIGGARAVADNAALIGALVALGGVFTNQLVNIALRQRQSLQQRDLTEQGIEQRIARLTKALSESSHVIQEMEAEMRERSELVERLRRDTETYERLMNINREQAEAVAQALQRFSVWLTHAA